jgi:hypothetical protein
MHLQGILSAVLITRRIPQVVVVLISHLLSRFFLQELVQYEYELVYGADAVASVHPLRYSNELAGLETQYTTAKQVLEDQLNHYQLLLLRGGRRPGAFMRLRSCFGNSLTGQLQRSRLAIVPIALQKVSMGRRLQLAGAAEAPISAASQLGGWPYPVQPCDCTWVEAYPLTV